MLPRQQRSYPEATPRNAPSERAGKAIEPLLRRAQGYNLSAIRVLDERGCVVATTRSEDGACMREEPEVQRALAGQYSAVLRERISDEPPPRLGDIRRRGKVRVFSALPVLHEGRVIGVVRASRTGLDALSSLWANRRELIWAASLGVLLLVLVSLTFSAAIARPIERLTQAARKRWVRTAPAGLKGALLCPETALEGREGARGRAPGAWPLDRCPWYAGRAHGIDDCIPG